jgi:hypothetical protein
LETLDGNIDVFPRKNKWDVAADGQSITVKPELGIYYSGASMLIRDMGAPNSGKFAKAFRKAMREGKAMRISVPYLNKFPNSYSFTAQDAQKVQENIKWLFIDLTPEMLSEWQNVLEMAKKKDISGLLYGQEK